MGNTLQILGYSIQVPTEQQALAAQTYGLWIQTGAIVLSVVVAIVTILTVRIINQKRATLDLLRQLENDTEYRQLRQNFTKLREDPQRLVHWAAAEHDRSDERITILSMCNHYEMIAVGIREGILHEGLYRRWFRTQLVRDWEESKAFAMEIRDRRTARKLFCEFQWLAEKWGATKD